jgi:exosortase A-associated hydrolase 1
LCNATLDAADGATGLLIVSGGNEIRVGSHGGMARLAAEIASAGFPVFRFDRRGVGDSEGVNGGFESSGADIQAALTTFRAVQPHLKNIVAMGNCDGATALILHRPDGFARLILTNPWVVEAIVDEPAPAAARAYYAERFRNPRAWLNLLRGRVNMRKAAGSISSAVKRQTTQELATRVAAAIANHPIPASILIAAHDGTAIAFADQWATDVFAPVRHQLPVTQIDSPSHSFASSNDHAKLRHHVLAILGDVDGSSIPEPQN